MTTRRPRRADARRNRAALLAAAQAVFARQGLDAPLDAVAREAGVDRATLYRNFASRDELIGASFEAVLDELAEFICEYPDADRAFLAAVERTALRQREDLGLIDLLTARGADLRPLRVPIKRFLGLMRDPLQRGQKAGLVRSDLVVDDLLPILLMLLAAVRWGGPGQQERTLAFVLDAMSPR